MRGFHSARIAGQFALSAISSAQEGRVIAAFERSFYIRFDTGSIICIGVPSIGNGPLNLIIDQIPRSIYEPEAEDLLHIPVHVSGDGLLLGRTAIISTDHVKSWMPGKLPADWSGAAMRNLPVVHNAIRSLEPLPGLGRLIRTFLEPGAIIREDELVRSARPAIGEVMGWTRKSVLEGDAGPPPVEDLLGLGPGLTPSGDDFLAGYMIALHAFGQSDLAGMLEAAILSLSSTNDISMAHLRCAAAGQAGEPLMKAIGALGGSRFENLQRPLSALDQVGHSSGWDGLTGVLAACCLMKELTHEALS